MTGILDGGLRDSSGGPYLEMLECIIRNDFGVSEQLAMYIAYITVLYIHCRMSRRDCSSFSMSLCVISLSDIHRV